MVKIILKYLSATIDYGVWYLKYSNLSLDGYSNVDWVSNVVDRKNTNGGGFYTGGNLVTWMSKKQNSILLSIVEAEDILTDC